MNVPPKVLDLCCGLGGWSKGFDELGFDCTGVDIVNVGYPFNLILCDIRNLDGKRFRGFDVIVGSPPCRDFTTAKSFYKVNWAEPPDPSRGLELVYAFLRIVEEANPRYWLMENVPGLVEYLEVKPKMVVSLAPYMKRALWGDFPLFLVSPQYDRIPHYRLAKKLRSWKAAEIPIGTSRPLAQAINRHIGGSL